MTLEDEQGPPRKRQRHSASPEPETLPCRRILLEELDLEVALRERLTSTVQSRITWALLLQEALQKELQHPGLDNASEFRTAALDALEAIEGPSNPIFSRDVRLPPRPASVPPVSAPLGEATSTASSAPPSSAYSTRNRGAARVARPPPRKLLFLRNTASYPPQIAKLACPDCARTDFSSLQGLLNHCRLSHKREFGSHDECVQCCAVLVEGAEEQAWVVAHGTEVGGITIPGLRRLFEMAVGGGRDVPLLPAKTTEAPSQDTSASDAALTASQGALSRDSSAPITRTLGHHADSPGLAHFLGRAPKQRTIHVYDENQPVDIFGDAGSTHKKTHWRMPYPHRNKARAALDVVIEPPALSTEPPPEGAARVAEPVMPDLQGPVSRFHMMARVSVRDLSFWMPPGKRSTVHPEHTHRWRLAVSSPSYSLPLNAILKRMTIRSVTDPPPLPLLEPIVVDRPPFVVTSTTDKPFLARITFEWAGAEGQNPPLEVEHWVELDPLQRNGAVLGDEQVFDVGLDRTTELLPVQDRDEHEPSWDADDVSNGSEDQSTMPNEEIIEPDYVLRLRSLAPQFPLTMRDFRVRLSRQIPYTLVATPAQFRALNDGRRKAIEWGRAHALRQAYDELCTAEPWPDGRQDIPLTTGDVFRWLEDEGLFLRESRQPVLENASGPRTRKEAIKSEEQPPAEEYCRHCGLHYLNHPPPPNLEPRGSASVGAVSVKIKPIAADALPQPAPPSTHMCSGDAAALGLPVVDVNRLLDTPSLHADDVTGTPYGLHPALFGTRAHDESFSSAAAADSARDLLRASDPKLVLAIQDLAAKWKLDRMRTPAVAGSAAPLDDGPQGTQASALLALAMRSFVGALTKSAVGALRRDEAGLQGPQRARARRAEQQRGRLLTPAHVAKGLARDAARVPACGALVLAMAPLGMALPPVDGPADGDGDAARER
ncbi:hypothetical protein PsYK624_048630 [Phanerochaete sordida]|uniref:YEATS domain-containing protein n=1 Tax=Phanerochaete sordida TaxID=48140 RepID=A0A9P3G442_9APHY|nr:hypothetical protein PsYK624_048630 [Phanerochaete sordida]